MKTQEKFDQAKLLRQEANKVIKDFIENQIAKAAASFETLKPAELKVRPQSVEIRMTENSPRFTMDIREGWDSDWRFQILEVNTSMSSCYGARAEDFLAMAEFAPVMEKVLDIAEKNINLESADLNAKFHKLSKEAFDLEQEAKKEAHEQYKLEKAARLEKFNKEILNNGFITLDEPVRVELTADFSPKIDSIEVTQKPKQDSFTVKVTTKSLNGENTFIEEARVCGRFKQNVMGLFA